MNVENIKREIGKVVKIDEDEFESIIKKFTMISLKKNEIWEEEGKISQWMGFVDKGMLRQYYTKNGNEFTDSFFSENDFIGNYISYLSKSPSTTITIALEPCELIVIPFRTIEELYITNPIVEEFSKKVGEFKIFEMNKRNASLLMDTPEERYYALVEQKPDLINRVPQYLIAQYLGIKPESLSRIRKRHLS